MDFENLVNFHNLIVDAYARGYLYGYHEYDFLHSIMWEVHLSPRQDHWLSKILRRINLGIVVRPDLVVVNDEDDEDDEAD